MPRLKEIVAKNLQAQYPRQGTILEKMKFLNRFAVPVMSKAVATSVENLLYEYYDELAAEMVQLTPDQRTELGVQWGNYIAECEQTVMNQLEDTRDVENMQFDEAAVALVNQGMFLSILRGCNAETYSDEFASASRKAMDEAGKRAWTPKDMSPENANEVYRQKAAIINSFVTTDFRDMEKFAHIPEAPVKKAIAAAQKQVCDTLSPNISSMATYGEDLQNALDRLNQTTLPGMFDSVKLSITQFVDYVKANGNVDLSVDTPENRKIFDGLKDRRNIVRSNLTSYIRDIDRNSLTNDQQTALERLNDIVEPIVGEHYADFKMQIVAAKPGFQVYGNDTYHVKKETYGSFIHYKSEDGVWVDEYIMDHTKVSPKSATLPDGTRGVIYQEDTFNFRDELQKVVDDIAKRRPELAKYLKFNEEEISQAQKSTPDKTKPLKDFLYAFNPANNIGANEPYKVPMAQQVFDQYFMPAPDGTKITDVASLADELDSLYEKFYGIGNTQRELMYAHLLDENGVSLPMNGTHEAMGEVADLLGVSDLLAPSERLPIVRDGKTVFVNFVKDVPGKSILDPEKENIFLDKNKNPMMTPQVMKTLADMQVLDYLCGTEFYRMDNDLVFQTDPSDPTRITGVTRTNAGTAFGTIDNSKDAFGKRLDLSPSTAVNPKSLMVINEAMAQKVNAMTDEDIARIMGNKTFKQPQIDAAIERLHQLKALIANPSPEIKSGSIHIMTDAEWTAKPAGDIMRDLVMSDGDKAAYVNADAETKKEMDSHLSQTEYEGNDNIFRKIYGVREMAKAGVGMEKTMHGQIHPSLEYIKGFQGKVQIAKTLTISMKEVLAELERTDPWYVRSSQEFKDMKEAAKDYVKTFAEMSKRWKRGEAKTQDDFKTLSEKMKLVGEKAGVYRRVKDRDGITGRTGPGRYASARLLEDFSSSFLKELSKTAYRSENEKRIENIRQYYNEKGLDKSLLPNLLNKKVVTPEQGNLLQPVDVPTSGIALGENDFSTLSYVIMFNPWFSGNVRKGELGITDEELSPAENVAAHSTFYTLDLSMDKDPSRKGEYMPRSGAGAYFSTIQKEKQEVGRALANAAEGKNYYLANILSSAMKQYVTYEIDNNMDPLAEGPLVNAKMMKDAVDFLERNPEIMKATRNAGLTQEEILKIKAKGNYAELSDRNDIAKQRLKRHEEGKEILSQKQERECRRDILAFETVKKKAQAELDQKMDANYNNRVMEGNMAMTQKLKQIQESQEAKANPKIYQKAQFLENAKFNLGCNKGIGMPRAIAELARGLEPVQKQAQNLVEMQQAQKDRMPVPQMPQEVSVSN